MEKIIKRTISLTTKKRDNRNKLFEEFYSHDKNTATFEFTVEGGVPTEEIVVLFHFKRTNRHLEVRGRVDNDKIIVNFDTSLIIKDEQVAGYIYYENGEKSNDVYRFMFDVYVSEIDKEHDLPVMEQESKRIVSLTDIVTKSEITELLKKIVANEKLYDDSEVKQQIESKADKETVQAISSKVEAVESRVQTLENKPPVDVSNLATKQELESVRNNQQTVDTSNLVTKQELENKHYIQEHQSLANLVTKDELESKGFLNAHQSLEEYAKKTEIPKIDISSFVTKEELEAKQYLKDHQSLDGYVKKSELPPQVDTSTFVSKQELTNMHLVNAEELGNVSKKMLEQTTKITALESKSEYEIHGTGMPNGTVSAPIGTTYVDTAVTNGALKWIKQSGTGNTGWKVLIGDTGWRTLNSTSKLIDGSRTSTIKIRRVNNLVTYNFGGLQWGWFGIVRRNGKGFVRHNSSGDKGAKVLGVGGIPLGFRSEASLIGGIYNDAGKPYGIWYLGGATDSNFIQFTFNDPIPTDKDIGDIRVNAISYLTDDEWPTVLP